MSKPILVLGASGYVGSRLVPQLLRKGWKVRAAGRSVERLKKRFWSENPNIELVETDVLDPQSLQEASHGCSVIFYLVHSMDPSQRNFDAADRKAALSMVDIAEKEHIERIIYLGGLGNREGELSKHLQSRIEVSDILHTGSTPVTTLRAAMIIGAGSISFEILRYLVDRLPIMTTPLWVSTKSQPIAISNVVGYLIGCVEHPETSGNSYDIGGQEILSYRELFDIYSEVRGLRKRWIIPVPVLTPKLSSYWISLVTPINSAIARPLAEGLRNELICQNQEVKEIIPEKLLSCQEAITKAVLADAQADLYEELESRYPGDPKWVR